MAAFDARKAATRGREVISGFTLGQRAVVIVGVVLLGVAAMFVSKWSSAPSYSPLFTNLSAKDASAIVDKLNTDHVSYQLTEGGTAIEVPQAKVYPLRLEMAAASLPSGADGSNTGYDLLDKQGVTTSDFIQQVDYQRALEGQLESTIEAIDGVQSAIVNVVVPSSDVFATGNDTSSASVLVTTASGVSLTSQQVQAVVHLVASSVAGLSADDVTVADGQGHVLSAPGVDTGADADAASQQTTAYDTQQQQSVQDMLDSVLGPGHAVVRVNADLNLDSVTSTESQFIQPSVAPGASAVPLQQSISSESYGGSGAAGNTVGVLGPNTAGASAGAVATTPATSGSTPSSGASGGYSQVVNDQTNGVGRVDTSTKVTPGSVKRLSVAVLIDQSALKSGITVAALQQNVQNAVGFEPARGDSITVTPIAFSSTAAAATGTGAKVKAAGKSSSMTGLIKLAIPALGLILVLVAAIRGVRKVERTPLLQPQERLELEAARRALAAVERRQLETGNDTNRPLDGGHDNSPRGMRADEIGGLVDRQPDEVAELLRGWLAETR